MPADLKTTLRGKTVIPPIHVGLPKTKTVAPSNPFAQAPRTTQQPVTPYQLRFRGEASSDAFERQPSTPDTPESLIKIVRGGNLKSIETALANPANFRAGGTGLAALMQLSDEMPSQRKKPPLTTRKFYQEALLKLTADDRQAVLERLALRYRHDNKNSAGTMLGKLRKPTAEWIRTNVLRTDVPASLVNEVQAASDQTRELTSGAIRARLNPGPKPTPLDHAKNYAKTLVACCKPPTTKESAAEEIARAAADGKLSIDELRPKLLEFIVNASTLRDSKHLPRLSEEMGAWANLHKQLRPGSDEAQLVQAAMVRAKHGNPGLATKDWPADVAEILHREGGPTAKGLLNIAEGLDHQYVFRLLEPSTLSSPEGLKTLMRAAPQFARGKLDEPATKLFRVGLEQLARQVRDGDPLAKQDLRRLMMSTVITLRLTDKSNSWEGLLRDLFHTAAEKKASKLLGDMPREAIDEAVWCAQWTKGKQRAELKDLLRTLRDVSSVNRDSARATEIPPSPTELERTQALCADAKRDLETRGHTVVSNAGKSDGMRCWLRAMLQALQPDQYVHGKQDVDAAAQKLETRVAESLRKQGRHDLVRDELGQAQQDDSPLMKTALQLLADDIGQDIHLTLLQPLEGGVAGPMAADGWQAGGLFRTSVNRPTSVAPRPITLFQSVISSDQIRPLAHFEAVLPPPDADPPRAESFQPTPPPTFGDPMMQPDFKPSPSVTSRWVDIAHQQLGPLLQMLKGDPLGAIYMRDRR